MRNNKVLLGIDEAGRGCVIGPLVIAGVLVNKEDITQLTRLSGLEALDSKRFTRRKREELQEEIESVTNKAIVTTISPEEIDQSSLNLIELEKTAKIIDQLQPDIVYFDVPTHPGGVHNYCKDLEHLISDGSITLVGENEADKKYPIVGAASITAKVKRDEIIHRLREKYGDFGWGYPSEKATQKFLRDWYRKHGEFPNFVRTKWRTVQSIINPQLSFDWES